MGRAFDSITDAMRSFVDRQHLFFVATAPREGGHVNLSPKGLDSFRVLSPDRVAYLDLTGSGAETIAHLRDDGRITFMFCAFDGKPNIVRFYGRGRAVRPGDEGWDDLHRLFHESDVADDVLVRSIIVADIDRTSTSCGFAVPFMDFVSERDQLVRWGDGKSADDITDYWAEKNASSIDGLPALSG